MKKYKPYSKIKPEMRGIWLKHKKDHNEVPIIGIYSNNTINVCNYGFLTFETIFDQFTYINGTPFGEAYEEEVVLVRDRPYLVRSSDVNNWCIRYYAGIHDNVHKFTDNGYTSLISIFTSSWKQVCEYYGNEDLNGIIGEPKEYLIKQS